MTTVGSPCAPSLRPTCALVLAVAAAFASPARAAEPGAEAETADGASEPPENTKRRPRATAPSDRRFLVGLEGVVIQAPALRPHVIRLDPRFVGNSVALGGAGLFGRFRPVPILAVELSVRSGSVAYRDRDKDKLASEDMLLATTGLLLYLAHAERARLAVDGGLGGQFHRVAYFTKAGRSVQRFGAFVVHAGLDAEFLLSRVAFVLSVRTYGVVSDDRAMTTKGPAFEDPSATDLSLPVTRFQTYVAATAGLAYRF